MKTIIILVALLSAAAGQTLNSVTPNPWAGSATTVVLNIGSPLQDQISYYYLTFVPYSSGVNSSQFAPGSCSIVVTIWHPYYSIININHDTGDDLTNAPTPSGVYATLDQGFQQDYGPIHNSSCTVSGFNGGAYEVVNGDGSLTISIPVVFNVTNFRGTKALYYSWRHQVQNGGFGWLGPVQSNGGASPYIVEGAVSFNGFPSNVQGPAKGVDDSFTATKVGVYRGGDWYLELSGNVNYASNTTATGYFSSGSGAVPVQGDWTGTGQVRVGTFSSGYWLLDTGGLLGNSGDSSVQGYFGIQGDVPVVGNWTGNGVSNVGVFRNGTFFLDTSGTANYSQSTAIQGTFGQAGDTVVLGDWNGDGRTKVGIFRGGLWLLDTSGTANYNPSTVIQGDFGIPGDIPVVGKWDTSGRTKVGVYRPSTATFYLDISGTANYSPNTTIIIPWGQAGDMPIIGDWNSDGTDKVGIWRQGLWILNTSQVTAFNGSSIIQGWFGGGTDVPVVGKW